MRSSPLPMRLWVASGVVAHTLWTSAAPAMTYPLYIREWGLSTTQTTLVFAVYPAVVVLVMLFAGDLADHVGRRKAMLWGLAASGAGVALFAVATGLDTLIAGRVLMGVGVGLSAGPSAAAVAESAPDRRTGAAITVAAQAAGLIAALAIDGVMVEYAPFPLHLPFVVLLTVIALLFALTLRLETTRARPGRWRPHLPDLSGIGGAGLGVATIALVTAYAHGVMVAALGAQIAGSLVGSTSSTVNGLALALFPLAFGLVGLWLRVRDPRRGIFGGALSTATAMALLTASILTRELVFFVAATFVSGVGYALLVAAGFQIIDAGSTATDRAGRISFALLFAYLVSGALALALGWFATLTGLSISVFIGAGLMAALAAASVAGAWRQRPA
ncbi:MFS transporter [Acuticoccus sediminis]|uniref:MFS transporter n=1 Tax=Acuticoccus sediminis TaxID=2184697 RepID=UPI001CFE2BD3|nr:MFS transporter [Acuticoccus sediminis]